VNVKTRPSFDTRLARETALPLQARELTTLQINVGKYCNQACRHCHVDAGPHRIAEQMSGETATQILDVLRHHPQLQTLDITGGAPELNSNFKRFVSEARSMRRTVIDRCNLTIFFVDGYHDMPEFLAANQVQVIASLPCYLEENVDKQRGSGVFENSIRALTKLNALGYGNADGTLKLDLVYNPLGPSLPPPQHILEAAYRQQLMQRYGIVFNQLYTITNMPIARFKHDLAQSGKLDDYMDLLVNSFNPAALPGLMCRSLISVGWDGKLYDCDFNQMLDMELHDSNCGHIRDFNFAALQNRQIRTAEHCFGCAAGAGSSCSGALTRAG